MTATDTIDWTEYWRDADADARESSSPSEHHAVDVVVDFLATRGVADARGSPPDADAGDDPSAGAFAGGAVADVGCGAGATTFAVAEAFPDATAVGYDVAEPVLAENRERARERGVDNVAFERGELPGFDPDREFDVVFSYFTLCYVPEVESALRALYDAVAPGGALLFNYPNRYARSRWRTMAANPDEHLGEGSAFDPDRFAERFAPLLSGESCLSYRAIADALGTWPRSAWSVAEKPDVRWAWRDWPLVYVPK